MNFLEALGKLLGGGVAKAGLQASQALKGRSSGGALAQLLQSQPKPAITLGGQRAEDGSYVNPNFYAQPPKPLPNLANLTQDNLASLFTPQPEVYQQVQRIPQELYAPRLGHTPGAYNDMFNGDR